MKPTQTKPEIPQSQWLEPLSEIEKNQWLSQLAEPEDEPNQQDLTTEDPSWLGDRFMAYGGLVKALVWFAGGFVGLQAGMLVLSAWQIHWSLGAVATGLVGLPGLWLGQRLWRARRNLKRINALEQLRASAQPLVAGAGMGGFDQWASQLEHQLPAYRPLMVQLRERVGDYGNDAECFEQLDLALAQQCDKAAQAAVAQATRRTALGVAASPFLALDLVLAVSSNLSLIGKVARAYGLPPSPFLEARLLVQVYRQIATLGAIELGSELAGQALSHELLARLSGRVAQGFSAGLYTYRIGVTAMALCRPLAFSDASRPKPGRLFSDLFSKLEES